MGAATRLACSAAREGKKKKKRWLTTFLAGEGEKPSRMLFALRGKKRKGVQDFARASFQAEEGGRSDVGEKAFLAFVGEREKQKKRQGVRKQGGKEPLDFLAKEEMRPRPFRRRRKGENGRILRRRKKEGK